MRSRLRDLEARLTADAQRWHDAYLRWGRQTLGFGYYLLRRP